jgi:site-specific DNA-methyltransferase (adenine-specific)
VPKKATGNSFVGWAERLLAAGQLKGTLLPLVDDLVDRQQPQELYRHPGGCLFVGDSLRWLPSLPDRSVDLVFADPPYNLNRLTWDRFPSQDAYIGWSLRWIAEAARVLRDHGSLYLCGFSEILADLRRPAAAHFAEGRWLVWHYKNKANLTSTWGRSHESLIHFRKGGGTALRIDKVRVPYGAHTLRYPSHPQAASSQYGKGKARDGSWLPHPDGAKPRDVLEIPVTSNGMKEKTPHPTQKPEELLRYLLLGSSRPGDVVLDPFVGSGTTLVAAEQLGRTWLGCDSSPTYCRWTVARIESVSDRGEDHWRSVDREAAARRTGIR